MYNSNRYKNVISAICKIKGIRKEELYKILKDKECKYLLFLLLNKNKCIDIDSINRDFSINSKRVVNNNIRKAQEKLLINREFREIYFSLQDELDKRQDV
ncbi:ribose 5-phosphate isomerase [Clostridium novyi A str. 4552]|uniref:Ribose 5-phosphate isomerase n=1 Tax=Clostridium novyi A str. 4552 TaxID=1444289 RepID=A0A0A0IFK5_CLONO|nr:hypothetical protein [Clostridium novyi]KGM98370.1 ribose 5-phosphate isomerase [Clostridium novyi A str. 4552]